MRIKPSFPRLRQGHPLASGLACAFAFSEKAGQPLDLVRNAYATIDGSPVWTSSAAGDALSMPGASGINIASVALGNSRAISYAVGFRYNGVSGNFPRLIWCDGSASPTPVVGFREFTNQVFFSVQSLNDLLGPTLVVGNEYWLAFTHPGGTGTSCIYDDGRLFSSGSAVASNYGTATVRVGYRSSTQHASVDMFGLKIWNRELSAVEVSELHADPFAMFRPRQRSYFTLSGTTPGTKFWRNRQTSQINSVGVIG
jgi:hypothetical protein